MAWRKWMVRGIVYGIIGVAASAALAYQHWTNPVAVRAQVITELGSMFPGAQISVDSARLRILGGIQLNGLRMTRLDDAESLEFLHVPSAVFYHDKEKILDGELTLRKIELTRPRIRIRRDRDGSWNLKGLMRGVGQQPMTALPAIVIHQGTLIFEDRSDTMPTPSVEINDISMTLVNDPVPTITIRGAASSELLGRLHAEGTFERGTNEMAVSFRARQIPLTQALVARLPLRCSAERLIGLQVQAEAQVEGKVSYHPGQDQPVFYDVRCEVKDGKVQHPQLPLPLDNLALKLQCSNGEVRLEELTARSGATELEARGAGQLPCLEQDFELHVGLQHVMLGKELAARLPDKIRELHEFFQPVGPTTIQVACARNKGEWTVLASGHPSQVSLRPENIALTFTGFPYPLQRTTGEVDYNILTTHVKVRLMAHAGDRPVILKGDWFGEGNDLNVKFDIDSQDIPINDTLLHALKNAPALQRFAESFHATGRVDVKSEIRLEPGKDFRNEYRLRFKDGSVQWESFPLRLKNVSGFLDIFPEHWEFRDFHGTHGDGHVHVSGKSIPQVDAKGEESYGISLEITGRNIELNNDLHQALRTMPGLFDSWESFRPQGRLYFTASVKRPSADLNDLDVKVDARGCTLKPTFFPYQIQDVSGHFHFHHNTLEISKVRARHEQTFLALNRGKVDRHPRGGYYADFLDVQARGLTFDDEFLQALPPKLQDAARRLNLRDPVKVQTHVIVYQPPEQGKPPDIFWDGQVWLYGAKFNAGLDFTNVTGQIGCVGRHNGRQIAGVSGNLLLDHATLYDQPFRNVHAKFEMRETSPDVLLIGLRAPIYSGDIAGQVRVNLNSALSYELNLTASQINVAEFGRQNLGPKSQLSGSASARLYLTGLGSGVESLDGHGAIDVPRGHLYNLPLLLDLLKFLGSSGPDRTAFEEFHTNFSIQGSKVQVQKLGLLGSAVSLSGKGDFDLASRRLELDVYPMWGRVEQLLPPAVRPLPTTFSKNLLTVEVRGKVSGNPQDLKFRMKPVPIIVDPLILLRDRMLGHSDTSARNDARGANVGISLPRADGVRLPDRQGPFKIWE